MARETTVFQHSFFKKFRYALERLKELVKIGNQQKQENIYDNSLFES